MIFFMHLCMCVATAGVGMVKELLFFQRSKPCMFRGLVLTVILNAKRRMPSISVSQTLDSKQDSGIY